MVDRLGRRELAEAGEPRDVVDRSPPITELEDLRGARVELLGRGRVSAGRRTELGVRDLVPEERHLVDALHALHQQALHRQVHGRALVVAGAIAHHEDVGPFVDDERVEEDVRRLLLQVGVELAGVDVATLHAELTEARARADLLGDLPHLIPGEHSGSEEHLPQPVVGRVAASAAERPLVEAHRPVVLADDVELAAPRGGGDHVPDLHDRHPGEDLPGHGDLRTVLLEHEDEPGEDRRQLEVTGAPAETSLRVFVGEQVPFSVDDDSGTGAHGRESMAFEGRSQEDLLDGRAPRRFSSPGRSDTSRPWPRLHSSSPDRGARRWAWARRSSRRPPPAGRRSRASMRRSR